MSVTKLLIANRGEVAIRIARAAADMGLPTVAVYSEDDSRSLHLRVADECRALPGQGAAAYLDAEAVIAAATASGCDAIHPRYGFLAERGDFARMCAEAGLTFVGPDGAHLELFGDKARARAAAAAAAVPVLRGVDHGVTLEEARAFLASLRPGSAMIVKALAGGGGRGTRAVLSADELEATFVRCRSEAGAAFGRADVYVEEFLPRARHVEVQILGDREGGIAHLGERECSIQRRLQKIVEIAPAPALDDGLRRDIIHAAVRFAKHVGYTNLGTLEFLVDVCGRPGAAPFVFIEANARLQVEHTVTEAVTGFDLVQAQIRLAQGTTLRDLGLDRPDNARPRGYAIQTRVNMETIGPDGSVRPGSGTLTVYEAPSGPGVRADGFGYAGYRTSGAFDSLLAKVIVHAKELMAIEDPEARLAEFQRRTAMAYDRAKAVNAAAGGGIDDVIDPADHARLDRQRVEAPAAGAGADRQEVPVHRPVVSTPGARPTGSSWTARTRRRARRDGAERARWRSGPGAMALQPSNRLAARFS